MAEMLWHIFIDSAFMRYLFINKFHTVCGCVVFYRRVRGLLWTSEVSTTVTIGQFNLTDVDSTQACSMNLRSKNISFFEGYIL